MATVTDVIHRKKGTPYEYEVVIQLHKEEALSYLSALRGSPQSKMKDGIELAHALEHALRFAERGLSL